jgi:hypothetical protein
MSICSNCKAKLGCSCQHRIATNGAPTCSTCIAAYEAKLKQSLPTAPVTPPNVNVFYKAP